MSNVNIGRNGEDMACKFLISLGYKILDRNFHIRGGEIDIIALDKNTLVFVEVKTRSSYKFGLPEEAVTPQKIASILRAAQFYIRKINWTNKPYRLDVIAIDYQEKDSVVRLIKNITF